RFACCSPEGERCYGRSGRTMDDLGTGLRGAHTRIPPPEPAFDRLLDRRDRKRRNSRIASIAMALAVMVGGLSAVVIALGSSGGTRVLPGNGPVSSGP